ncbi:E3 ubiquitin ligase BIG BROTHER-related-like [Impatiens glandulifera]|uniref:E3 ubiquitin ligase BIG BROTHER-related-like n=1 Tax=Impatiens glandulifera TaxID=253017 RepID=UPI001FB0C6F2|nr:E3 ubiquitin ligase BIG BROTHER-related-like [Impatiens glandulifera]
MAENRDSGGPIDDLEVNDVNQNGGTFNNQHLNGDWTRLLSLADAAEEEERRARQEEQLNWLNEYWELFLESYANGVIDLSEYEYESEEEEEEIPNIDNMSYEELLALQERIGIVNVGLSEDTITSRLKKNSCVVRM